MAEYLFFSSTHGTPRHSQAPGHKILLKYFKILKSEIVCLLITHTNLKPTAGKISINVPTISKLHF